MRYMYHATPYENLGKILENGLIPGPDGLIYLTEKPVDAVKFIAIRGYRDILVVEVKIPKKLENTIEETFDHSERFFQCRSFASTVPIKSDRIKNYYRYSI